MKRFNHLWSEIVDFDNLYQAYQLAKRGKAGRAEVTHFSLDLESNLLDIQQQLNDGCWQPGPYRRFTIRERKPRQIAAAPFCDRVVHHALMRIIEPKIDRRLIDHSYACRRGKGVHEAVNQYQKWSQRFPYVLKLDVVRYFPSIQHEILKQKLDRLIKDHQVTELLYKIIDTSPQLSNSGVGIGIPIGNLTSQFFANLYLDRIDHLIYEHLHAPAYLRYMDDLILLGGSKDLLWRLMGAISEEMEKEGLRLHPRKAQIFRTALGIDLFGYQIWPHRRRLRSDNGHRFKKKLKRMAYKFHQWEMGWDEIHPSVRSWVGHAVHGETLGLRKAIFNDIVFSRGSRPEELQPRETRG